MDAEPMPSEISGEVGLSEVHAQVARHLRWVFREQRSPEHGIDAQVEVLDGEVHTGRLLALQIKGGPSYFSEPTESGWIFRFSPKKAKYWLGHALPVVVVIVDTETGDAYWQRVTAGTVRQARKNYYIEIPRNQTVATAREAWELAAGDISRRAAERYSANLGALPPSAVEALRRMEGTAADNAQVLAGHLAEGRNSPSLIVESLLVASPLWLAAAGPLGWLAVGAFASEHDLPELAARSFIAAADLADADERGKYLTLAGFQTVQFDAAGARPLFEAALEGPVSRLAARIGLVLADAPPGEARPLPVPEDLDLQTPEAAGELAVQTFLGLQALRARNNDEAINRFEVALSLRPYSSTTMVALAQVHGRRAATRGAHVDDLDRARGYAEEALEQRRQWAGDTLEPLAILLRMLSLQGHFDDVIRRAAPPPFGEASPSEAQVSTIARYALQASKMLSRDDVFEGVLDALEDEAVRHQLRVELGDLPSLPVQERIVAWRANLQGALAEKDYERVLLCVHQLAGMGVDESHVLDSLIADGIIPENVQSLTSAVARGQTDLEGALPALRSLAADDATAAEYLVQLLADARRFDDAVAACRTAYEQLRKPEFLALQAEVLASAGRMPEAESAARDALEDVRIVGIHRARLHGLVADSSAQREEWPLCERHLQAAVEAVNSPRPAVIWQLIYAQLNQRRVEQAASTIDRYAPTADSPVQARAWYQAMLAEPWDERIASEALTLANRFADDVELAGALLTHVIWSTRDPSDAEEPSETAGESGVPADISASDRPGDVRGAVSPELRARAFRALNAHIERHGDQTGVRQLTLDPDQLVEHLAEQLRERDPEPLQKLTRQIQAGRVPLGLLSRVVRRSYALALVQRAAGVQVAVAANEDANDADLQAARGAIGGSVVTEASSLLLAAGIGKFDELRGEFGDLRLPIVARDDILRALVEVRGLAASSGTLAWDHSRGGLVFYELSAHEWSLLSGRAELLNEAAAYCRLHSVPDLNILPDFDVRDDGAWLAPIQLAKNLGLPLWSDDVGLRQLARAVDVPAFGTLNLVEALTERAIERAIEGGGDVDAALNVQHRCVMQLLAQCVVDLPVDAEDIITQAANDAWEPAAGAVALARGSWWQWNDEPFTSLKEVYKAVGADRPDLLEAWQTAAMYGAASTFADPTHSATLLAMVALFGTSENPTPQVARAALQRAKGVALRLDLPDPASQAARATSLLHELGHLDDPSEFLAELLQQDGFDGSAPSASVSGASEPS